ncbi:MAG TPA: LuxR C-terminal-related transcriptional regulator, partial [Terrimesophilobacter sp.]|nr:LuxR C-terminal-related transcriptional regulator [Terrimesophilobacter sp.]
LNRDGHVSEAVEFWGVQLPLVQDADGAAWRLPPVLRERLRADLQRRDPERFAELEQQTPVAPEQIPALSAVELQVLGLLAQGQTAAGAARTLGVTFQLVKAHIRSLYEKLGVSTRASALHRADALGLLVSTAMTSGAEDAVVP